MGISPIEEIHAAIEKSENPFPSLAIVREPDVWDGGFPDVETLNAHASEAVFQALDRVRKAQSARNKITSMVITAAQGEGKSHIISRLRRRFKAEGGAMFVYAGVEKYDVNSINCEFQQTLAESLDRVGSEGVTQWQELATFMANQVLKAGNPNAQTFAAKTLVEKVSDQNQTLEKTRQWIDVRAAKYNGLPRRKRLDPDLVRAILWTLSEPHALYAIKWLCGKDLSESRAKELELPYSSTESRDSESKALDKILQILSLISESKALLICFDELDLPDSRRSNAGLARTQVVARLIKTLVDSISLSEASQGVVILTVMLPDTWSQKVKPMPGGVPDRISASNPINLKFPDGDSIIQLVTIWLAEFYQAQNLIPPTPVYPFEENQLRELGSGSAHSARKVLKWCAENFKIRERSGTQTAPTGTQTAPTGTQTAPTGTQTASHAVELAYNKELAALEHSGESWLEEKSKIAQALVLGFNSLKGQTVEKVKIEGIERVEPKIDNSGYIDFKICGESNGKSVKIGVAVVQQSGNAVMAALKRLIAYKRFGLTRGCLVRSKEISPAATEARKYLSKLLSPELGGKWVRLAAADIKPLLAIWSVHKGKGDYQLTDKQIIAFIQLRRLAVDNSTIREIISAPSGQIPEGLGEE